MRALLRLYPASFRQQFGDEMLQVWRDARRSGVRGMWLRNLRDLIVTMPRLRMEEENMGKRIGLLALLVAAVVGAAMVLTGARSGAAPFAVAGSVLAVIGLIVGVGAIVSRRGAERVYAGTARWWWIPAALVALFEVVFAVGEMIRDPKPENVFFIAVMAAFAALVVVGMKISSRRKGNWMIAAGMLPMLPCFWMLPVALAALLVVVMAVADNFRLGRAPMPAV